MFLYWNIGAGTVLTSSDLIPPAVRLGIAAWVGGITALKAKMSMGDQKKQDDANAAN